MQDATSSSPATFGQRLRKARNERGLSLKQLAAGTGLSKGFLSRVENDERRLSGPRGTLLIVTDALGIRPADLTGRPAPSSAQEETLGAALADTSDVIQGLDLDLGGEPPRAHLDELELAVGRLQVSSSDGRLGDAAEFMPALLADLHAHVAARSEVPRAARLLVLALSEARWIARCAGETDLSWALAERAGAAAPYADDPALSGFAQFNKAQSLTKGLARARQRARIVASNAAAELQVAVGHSSDAAQVYGSLHMEAAWSAVIGGGDEQIHLDEAADVAAWTGNGRAFRLWFGPAELAILNMAIAVERGRGGAVAEIARNVNPAEMPSRGRQADFWIQMGRGLAESSATHSAAVRALRRAEHLAPIRTRRDPMVQLTVTELTYTAGGEDLQRLARRLGLFAG